MHSARPAAARPTPSPPPHSPVTVPARTALVIAALSVVLVVLVAVEWLPLVSFDRAVSDALHRSAVAEPGFTRTNRVFSDWVWDPWTMRALAALAAVWLWLHRERLLAMWVVATSAIGTAAQQGLKAAVGRERPSWPDPVDSARYAAYPSGHAMTAAVTCGLLLWLLRRHGVDGQLWGWCVAVAAVSVAGVGFTRVYLGVHWPTDVLGGWLLGVCLVAAAVASYERVALSRGR
ncbi:phosphatase PAP2 family protein [Streptomyces sp. NPDC006208]|uniref:phosphatase PAP2 family protein n=1 Tax=Streptomyces sp. NPDC006208 TaxID=3156734 RepID=UPI0033AD9944